MGNKPVGKKVMIPVNFHLTEETLEYILKEAQRRQVSRSQVFRDLIERGRALPLKEIVDIRPEPGDET